MPREKTIDITFIIRKPSGVQVADFGGGIDEIPIMEMMPVIIGVSKSTP